MEIASNNVTITLHATVHLAGDSIEVSVGMGDTAETLTLVSLDSLLREYLDMHEFYSGGGYAPEALVCLRQLRKLVDSYILKLRSASASASPAKKARARSRKGARRAAGA